MDSHEHQADQEKERRNSNTEYMPTKCRITKPAPPKPATNPLQFIKVAPCPLFQKAHEQIKKVEEIKREEKEMRTEVEDWQTNLDNWKSSRRKRQEHIIERVVEVKKLTEQEKYENSRRKSKTFSEMMEERSKGRHKYNIPLYEDDSNDLSDYGIGSSSSKTNSIKDADTDDSSSILDEKDNHMFDLSNNKENSTASNQSQSEDESSNTKTESKTLSSINNNTYFNKTFTSTYSTSLSQTRPKSEILTKPLIDSNSFPELKETKQYTYEGAIQDYRSRIQTINSEDSGRYKAKDSNEILIPKGEIYKRKGLFEKQTIEINPLGSSSSRRLSEDFANTKSIKDRLRSFEQNNDQITKAAEKSDIQVSVRERLQNFNKPKETDNMNNNVNKNNVNKISNYLVDKSNNSNFEKHNDDRCFSPETELYVNKLNMFNRDLDSLMINKSIDDNYAPSLSSTELTCISSDREDSGIHTGDVSCSVSQADELTDIDVEIPLLHEDTQFERDLHQFQVEMEQYKTFNKIENEKNINNNNVGMENEKNSIGNTREIINMTKEFLKRIKEDASNNLVLIQKEREKAKKVKNKSLPVSKPKPVIYENIDIKFSPAVDYITNDFIRDSPFPYFNPPSIEPPKVKPPPPPPPKKDEEKLITDPIKRANSTKRIKKEINIKRSSFLGLEEPVNDIVYPVEQPPELTIFFQKEQKIDKSFDRKYEGDNLEGVLSKVESQDSGLDLDRGRLSSDTWCSSVGDFSAPSHERQASEQTNSVTSEEDEITKKEREIIELVEKEEQYRDIVEYVNEEPINTPFNSEKDPDSEPSLGSKQFNSPYFHTQPSTFLDQDSEVLKVEQELRQLELEEFERQRENMLFRESRAKAYLHSNRRSLENLTDKMHPCYLHENHVDCRKSLPEIAIQKVTSPFDYRCSAPVSHNYGYENVRDLKSKSCMKSGLIADGNLGIPFDNRKSMPDLQSTQKKSSPEHHTHIFEPNVRTPLEHRKSMPELQLDVRSSTFKTPTRHFMISAKPLRTRDRNYYEPNIQPIPKQIIDGHRNRHEKWIQPKPNHDGRNYNQHWLIQEAELRRISDQQKKLAANNVGRQQPLHCISDRLPNNKLQNPIPRPKPNFKEGFLHHSYRNHPQSVNHALSTVAYSPSILPKESNDRVLSVSGKKKCSYCGNELGRGAAMIVESLCLFYHMDCFKCCVCHVQLGDGMMGTDVKVRNQKLHCHNCYSSDDGVKFSCV